MKLNEHNINLFDGDICLRPMDEKDWDVLLKWNNDPEVLYYIEGDDTSSHSLDSIQNMYRIISQNAYCFIIEKNKIPIGECWLQRMNLKRIIKEFPGLDVRRIDIMIGEREYWGMGIGIKVIKMLVKYGFEEKMVDMIFGCDIGEHNPRSLNTFKKSGFKIHRKNIKAEEGKVKYTYDVFLDRDEYIKNYKK